MQRCLGAGTLAAPGGGARKTHFIAPLIFLNLRTTHRSLFLALALRRWGQMQAVQQLDA